MRTRSLKENGVIYKSIADVCDKGSSITARLITDLLLSDTKEWSRFSEVSTDLEVANKFVFSEAEKASTKIPFKTQYPKSWSMSLSFRWMLVVDSSSVSDETLLQYHCTNSVPFFNIDFQLDFSLVILRYISLWLFKKLLLFVWGSFFSPRRNK